MKRIFLTIAILLFNTGFVNAYQYTQEDLIEVDVCRSKGTSECYENIFYRVDNDWVRLNYIVALLNEKKIEQAKLEAQSIVNNSENPNSVRQANSILKRIEKLEEDMRVADLEDEGDYLSDMYTTSRWQYPTKIKVYIFGETGKEYLFEEAFNTWDNAVSRLHFSYVDKIEEADIQCYFINNFLQRYAGVTVFQGGTEIINGVKYIKAPVIVKIAEKTPNGREYTNTELLAITLHELGHALGIEDHSKNKNDIMYFSTDTYQNTSLSNRDINTLNKIYE